MASQTHVLNVESLIPAQRNQHSEPSESQVPRNQHSAPSPKNVAQCSQPVLKSRQIDHDTPTLTITCRSRHLVHAFQAEQCLPVFGLTSK